MTGLASTGAPSPPHPVLADFHPAVAEWFRRRFPDGPTEPQEQGWPLIAKRQDTLIAAPTGSGKTLSAFLVAIDELYKAYEAAAQDREKTSTAGEATDTTSVVYVSPLKALAVDIAANLLQPLDEIKAVAGEMGMTAPEIRVGVRTGDTSNHERQLMVRRPPHFVVTTPESLYLLVTSGRGRDMLRSVETVIVDEIHAVARDKRGSHLALTLERLEGVAARRPVRVGLSATQRPIETIGGLLVGDRPPPAIVDVGHRRDMDLAIELPEGDLEAVASGEQMGDVVNRIASLVLQHRTTLVFVNTRRLAERFAHQLGEKLGHLMGTDGPADDVVAAHHGSLSKDRRHRVETRLRAGDLRALVATASLELGIDVGPVELVCQIGSARSIATLLQRVGRSNHSRHGRPKGRVFPLTRDELVECTATLMAVRSGRLDAVEIPQLSLDIAAQQIVAEVAAEEVKEPDLYKLLRRAAPYEGLEESHYRELVELVSDGISTGRGKRGAYVHHDGVNGELRARKGARLAAVTSGGAIPETGDYRVVAEPDDAVVGTVDEDFAVESMVGDIFMLGTHSWQVRRVEAGVLRVRDAGDTPPTIPFWMGEAPARTDELSAEVAGLREQVEGHLVAGDPDAARSWIVDSAGVSEEVAAMIVDYLAAGRAALGVLPTQKTLVLERFFDDTGGMQLVAHSPFGGRINRALGLALRKKFCRSFNFELQAAATDDNVVISLGPHHSFPLDEVPRYLNSETVRDTLEQAILDSPMFQSRWRWNLNRSLMVLRFRGGKRNPPPIQRMESDDMLAAVFPNAAACQENVTFPIEIPDHLLVRQTVEDTLREALDIEGFTALWRDIEGEGVRVHCVDTTEPSVLSHEILTARPYAFLDDEEAQNRRVNAVSIRRGLEVDLSAIGKLEPDAIARVHDEIRPVPDSPDDLHDVISSAVLLRPRQEWQALYDRLAERGRVQLVRGASDSPGHDLWYTTEGQKTAEAAVAGDEDAAVEVVRGHLEMSGILTEAELAADTGLSAGQVTWAVNALQTEGFAFQGHYRQPAEAGTEADGEVEWVARRLLARMHSYSRRQRRAGVEPATAQDFMRFLLRWQHVAPGTKLNGADGLRAVLDQLQGTQAAAGSWERELLSRRLHHYNPLWLDGLCHAGEVAWLRLVPRQSDPEDGAPATPSSPSKATPISVVRRSDLPWLLAAARGEGSAPAPEVGATAEVVEVLAERGACFSSDLVAATRRLPDDIERALWDGVARGLLMCDGFAAIRARVSSAGNGGGRARRSGSYNASRLRRPYPPLSATRAVPPLSAARAGRSAGAPVGGGLSRLRSGGSAPPAAAGRWSLVPSPAPDPGSDRDGSLDPDDVADAVAEQLLNRWGVVMRDLALGDGLRLPWREVQRALRRLEDRGLVRGGRFVTGFSGEQYALPDAAEALTRVRNLPRTGERVVVNATDPLNLVGAIVPGQTVPAIRTNEVVYIDGLPAPNDPENR